MNFESFPKIARISRDCVITEKIDGTNAQISIDVWTPDLKDGNEIAFTEFQTDAPKLAMRAGSRNRWITPKNDNYGFATWAQANASELFKLGAGRHFGEWWGAGIQRGYGLKEKRFSLFNAERWRPAHGDEYGPGVNDVHSSNGIESSTAGPACCYSVPVLYRGIFHTSEIRIALAFLEANGSTAAPGFMDPEGIIIWHTAAQVAFKKTIKDDEKPKGQAV